MFNLNLTLTRCTLKCQMKGKRKKNNLTPVERTLGMWDYLAICTPPITYASVKDRLGNERTYGPEIGTKCQE